MGAQVDPWLQVDDLEGTALYDALGLNPKATVADIKTAYRTLARRAHPDKGGDPGTFGRIQGAYETLIDPQKRAVYDAWAKELQFRYVRSMPAGVPLGGEDILLDEFEHLGLKCNPATQLVITCEVCRRPATKKCWTCAMDICEFCTLKRHWKGTFPLHWPLINSDHMKERLGKRELERKRIEDSKTLALQDPNFRSETQLKDIRAFRLAASEIAARPDARTTFDLRLGRFYMWAQSARAIYIACKVPAGYADRELVIECTHDGLLIQSESSPPLINRLWSFTIDAGKPIESFKTEDNTFCALVIPKGVFGEHWDSVFKGDSTGLRCLQPPYSIFETAEDCIIEVTLPFWTEAEDVCTEITTFGISVKTRSGMTIDRTFWRNKEEEARRRDYVPIEPEQCAWSMDDDVDAHGEKCRVLLLSLARPPATEEEVMYKKGVRQDNRSAQRQGSMHLKGYRLFVEDEDEFGLEDILSGLVYAECGAAYIAPKPWGHEEQPRWARSMADLPDDARIFVEKMMSKRDN